MLDTHGGVQEGRAFREFNVYVLVGCQDGRSRLSEQEVRDDRLQVPCLGRTGLRIADVFCFRGTDFLIVGRLVVVVVAEL
jgi:hypothetical protein